MGLIIFLQPIYRVFWFVLILATVILIQVFHLYSNKMRGKEKCSRMDQFTHGKFFIQNKAVRHGKQKRNAPLKKSSRILRRIHLRSLSNFHFLLLV